MMSIRQHIHKTAKSKLRRNQEKHTQNINTYQFFFCAASLCSASICNQNIYQQRNETQKKRKIKRRGQVIKEACLP
jgi:hypothetical protein